MRKSRNRFFFIALLVLAARSIPAEAGSLPPLSPTPGDKCPVCGMFVAKYPDWLAQVRFNDQKTVFFDGAKDLFKYLFAVDSYHPGRSAESVTAIYVTDYYTLDVIAAAAAFFVVGSDVYGPMGTELIAFSTAAQAEEFLGDHNGREIIRFDAVSAELLRTLDR